MQGNVDEGQLDELQASLAPNQIWHGLFADFKLASRRIAITHGHQAARLRTAQTSGDYDLVCYGHTHVAEQHHEGKTLVLNPGAIQRARIPSCAVVDLETMSVEILPNLSLLG